MKKLFVLITSLTILFFSCKKETSNLNPTSSKNMMTGPGGGPNVKTVPYVWKINSFVVNGNDMTSQLADYRFDIQTPQLMTGVYSIVAVSSTGTFYGKWNRVSYGEVIINFANFSSDASVPGLLTDDWTLSNNQSYDIAMQTGTKSLSFHTNGETWPSNE